MKQIKLTQPRQSINVSRKVNDHLGKKVFALKQLQVPGKDEWYIVYHRFKRPGGIYMGPLI